MAGDSTLNTNHEGEELLLPKLGREDYVWHTDDPVGSLLVFPCPIMVLTNITYPL